MNKTLLTVACLLACAPTAPAQTPDIAGRWEVTVVRPQGTQTAPMELKKDGDKFSGVFYTPQGNSDVTATVTGKAVAFTLSPLQSSSGPVHVSMSGTIDGDVMKGTLTAGDRGSFEWTAKRVPPPAAPQAPAGEAKADASGTWALDVTTPAGSGTPTVTLKQDGEKLSGHYSGLLGEAPLTGTIKGRDITFSFTVTVEGNSGSVIYTGTIDKDTMKGTVTLGELGEGTFTGKKK
jgi:hypothetical protein